jgi:hypothetical protein
MQIKRSLITILVFVMIGFFAVIFWPLKLQPQAKKGIQNGTQVENPAKSSNSPGSPVNSSTQLSSQEVEKMEERVRAREKPIMDRLLFTPIDFYGKVIDDKMAPVPEADVSVSFADSLIEKNTKRSLKTDGNGEFHVSGHGLDITVQVTKVGYYRIAQSNGTFGYVKEAGTVDDHASSDNPAIFVLRKVGTTVPMVRVHKDYLISKNGQAIEIDLSTGAQVGPGQGDLKVECWTYDQGHSVNSNTPYDWNCRISVRAGGLLKRPDSFDFQAPAEGYLPSDEIAMPVANGTAWRNQVARMYFIRTSGGRYGTLDFQMSAGGAHYFTVDSYMSLTAGERNVEPDFKK